MTLELIRITAAICLAQENLFEKIRPQLPNLLMMLGIGIICFFLMRRSSSFFRRRGPGDPQKQVSDLQALLGERSRDSAFADAPVEVLRWQVEMHATARDLKAELDSKIMTVQALLIEVRSERLKLEEALQKTEARTTKAEGGR